MMCVCSGSSRSDWTKRRERGLYRPAGELHYRLRICKWNIFRLSLITDFICATFVALIVPLLVSEYWIFSFLLQLCVLLSSPSALFSGASWSSRTAGSPGNVQLPKRSKHIHTIANTQSRLFHHPLCFIYLCAHLSSPPPLVSEDSVPHPSQTALQNGRRCPSSAERTADEACLSYTQLFTS